MPVVRPRVSFTDLQRAPEDGRRYELYDGEVCVVPAPMPRHQVVATNLFDVLKRYTESSGGLSFVSPIDIVFSEYDVVQPDVVLFVGSRRDLVDFDTAIRSAPDLVVEVLSPSTQANDRGRKMQMFARYGVPEYWIADPTTGCVEVHVLEPGPPAAFRLDLRVCGDEPVRSRRLEGLSFRASDVFRMP